MFMHIHAYMRTQLSANLKHMHLEPHLKTIYSNVHREHTHICTYEYKPFYISPHLQTYRRTWSSWALSQVYRHFIASVTLCIQKYYVYTYTHIYTHTHTYTQTHSCHQIRCSQSLTQVNRHFTAGASQSQHVHTYKSIRINRFINLYVYLPPHKPINALGTHGPWAIFTDRS